MRENGYVPSAGLVVFNQIDKKKKREITKEQLGELFGKLEGFIRDDAAKAVESIMAKLDSDSSGTISEQEWLENLARCPGLVDALQADIDPDTGKLKSIEG